MAWTTGGGGCSSEPEKPYRLIEEWAVVLDGSFHGIRDASDVTVAGERLIVLDRQSNRLHSVSPAGEYLGWTRLTRARDGFFPRIVVSTGEDRLLLASHFGNACEFVTFDLRPVEEDCVLPEELLVKYDLLSSPGALLAMARHRNRDHPVHVLQRGMSGFEVRSSFGPVEDEGLGPDSLALRHGVGRGTIAGSLIYVRIVPTSVEVWSLAGIKERVISPPVDTVFRPENGVAVREQGRRNPLLSDRVTGIAEWKGSVFSSVYSPVGDSSIVRTSPIEGGATEVFSVPFLFQIEAGFQDGLVVSRRLNSMELVFYRIQEG